MNTQEQLQQAFTELQEGTFLKEGRGKVGANGARNCWDCAVELGSASSQICRSPVPRCSVHLPVLTIRFPEVIARNGPVLRPPLQSPLLPVHRDKT